MIFSSRVNCDGPSESITLLEAILSILMHNKKTKINANFRNYYNKNIKTKKLVDVRCSQVNEPNYKAYVALTLTRDDAFY